MKNQPIVALLNGANNMETDSATSVSNSASSRDHFVMSRKEDDSAKGEEYPKLSDGDRLALFGGDKDLLHYYLGLRGALAEARQQGIQCFSDPRDAEMVLRVEQQGWAPNVVLKDLTDDVDSDFEFASKQTAFEENARERLTDSDDDGDDDANAAEEQVDGKEDANSFVCGVHSCDACFTSLASYESHYHSSHNFVCHVCHRRFVSNFLLDVHLEENHDSYFQVLSPRVDMYRCLVESCSLKFRTSDVRKDHLVTVHKFPARFSFHGPINNNRAQRAKPVKTKPHRPGNVSNNSSSSNCNNMETSDLTLDPKSLRSSLVSTLSSPAEESSQISTATMEVDSKVEKECESSSGDPLLAKSKNRRGNRGRRPEHRGRGRGGRVPSSICFGRGSQRAFPHRPGGSRGRHWHQTQGMDVDTTVDIEKVDFTDMVESLEGKA